MSGEHIFVDTNILVYAHDANAGDKHINALKCVRSLWDRPYPPAVSTQVLQELYVTLSKKGASNAECRKIVEIYLPWEVIDNNLSLLTSAIDIRERFKLSLWDSLIIAAAQTSKAAVLWSEDLHTGQNFAGVVVVNPLA